MSTSCSLNRVYVCAHSAVCAALALKSEGPGECIRCIGYREEQHCAHLSIIRCTQARRQQPQQQQPQGHKQESQQGHDSGGLDHSPLSELCQCSRVKQVGGGAQEQEQPVRKV